MRRQCWIAMWVAVVGCAVPEGEDTTETVEGLYAVDNFQLWSQRRINVCFEQAGFAAERAALIQKIETTWSTESSVNFVFGTGKCITPGNTATQDLRVRFFWDEDA